MEFWFESLFWRALTFFFLKKNRTKKKLSFWTKIFPCFGDRLIWVTFEFKKKKKLSKLMRLAKVTSPSDYDKTWKTFSFISSLMWVRHKFLHHGGEFHFCNQHIGCIRRKERHARYRCYQHLIDLYRKHSRYIIKSARI